MHFHARAGTIKGMESPITQPESPLEIVRRLENVVRMGTIAAVRHAQHARVRVKTGEVLSDWVPWFTLRAGECREWWPPTPGEQCLLISPGGDLRNGAALLGVYSNAHPQNSELPSEHRITWGNGDYMVHDKEKGTFILDCATQITLRVGSSSLTINKSGVFADPDIIAARTISLATHRHPGTEGPL